MSTEAIMCVAKPKVHSGAAAVRPANLLNDLPPINEAEAKHDVISLLSLVTEGSKVSSGLAKRHNLNGIASSSSKQRRRFLNHVKFDKDQQKFISHSVKN